VLGCAVLCAGDIRFVGLRTLINGKQEKKKGRRRDGTRNTAVFYTTLDISTYISTHYYTRPRPDQNVVPRLPRHRLLHLVHCNLAPRPRSPAPHLHRRQQARGRAVPGPLYWRRKGSALALAVSTTGPTRPARASHRCQTSTSFRTRGTDDRIHHRGPGRDGNLTPPPSPPAPRSHPLPNSYPAPPRPRLPRPRAPVPHTQQHTHFHRLFLVFASQQHVTPLVLVAHQAPCGREWQAPGESRVQAQSGGAGVGECAAEACEREGLGFLFLLFFAFFCLGLWGGKVFMRHFWAGWRAWA
jgi:hypothetical protein